MKRKIFTLLTFLLCAVTGAWATPTTIFNAADAGWSSATLTSGTTTVGDVTWYGKSSAALVEATYNSFEDASSFSKALNTAGNSTFKIKDNAENLSGVFTYSPAVDGILKVYAKGGGSSDRTLYISQSITTTDRDASTAIASISGASNAYVILEAYVEAEKKVYVWGAGAFHICNMTFEASNSDLALSTISGVTGVSASTSFTYTTSSTGTVTVASSDEAIATATVNTATNTVTVTGVAAGTATITVTQAADASYGKGVKKFTVTVNAPMAKIDGFTLASDVLDLTDADAMSTMLNGNWHASYGRALYGNDGSNNIVTYSFVGAYSSTADTYQTWVKVGGSSGSTGDSWDATGVFKGASAYGHAYAATTKNTGPYYNFRIKGASKVQALVDSRSSSKYIRIAAFEVTSGTVASSTILYQDIITSSTKKTISLDLDDAKEYLITFTTDNTGNVRLYEMALFYDESVTAYKSITPAKTYTTLTSASALDFTGSALKAYIAKTAISAGKVTLTQVNKVPANTGLVIKTEAPGTAVNVPMLTGAADDVTGNYMTGSATSTTAVAANAGYILSDGVFQPASAGTLPAGKAYLAIAVASAPSLQIVFDDIDGISTGINAIEKTATEDGVYYNLSGQRVQNPTKGLYIVNGKKVVVK